MKVKDCLNPGQILCVSPDLLEECLKSAGYFRLKAQRLRHFCRWYLAAGGFDALQSWPTHALRSTLLAVHGIGPETADDMLLYAFERPVFVIDAYTRRLAQRLRWIIGNPSYDKLQQLFEHSLPNEVSLYNQYHALIVIHAKTRCRKQKPKCESCLLQSACHYTRDHPPADPSPLNTASTCFTRRGGNRAV